MAYSYEDYTGNGSTTIWNIPFKYLSRDDIAVFNVDSLDPIEHTWLTDSQLEIIPAVSSSVTFRILRKTPIDKRVINFQNATVLDEADLDTSANQNFFVSQEVLDTVEDKLNLSADGSWDGRNKRISNVADPIKEQDVATKAWSNTNSESNLGLTIIAREEAQQSASEAAASEAAAATSETNATSAATSAATSETNAAQSETSASASATSAATSETNAATAASTSLSAKNEAEAARDGAVTAFDNFHDRYLGDKTEDPTTDNDGDSLLEGALYWNSVTKRFRAYSISDSTWVELPALTVAKTSNNGAAVIPTGATSQRPTNPAMGYMRGNTDTGKLEVYFGGKWSAVGGSGKKVGEPFFWFKATPPDDAFECNGAAISRAAYPELTDFLYVGDANNATAAWGYRCTDQANPTTTRSTTGAYVVLLDARGEFFRGWDNGRGIDPGRVLGSAQGDAIRNITGDVGTVIQYMGGSGAFYNGTQHQSIDGSGGSVIKNVHMDASRQVPTANENRPRNIAVMVCIKY